MLLIYDIHSSFQNQLLVVRYIAMCYLLMKGRPLINGNSGPSFVIVSDYVSMFYVSIVLLQQDNGNIVFLNHNSFL